MKHVFFVLLMVLLTAAHASAALETVGIPCKSIVVQKETAVLSSKKPVLILIHNSSSNHLWITHADSGKGAADGWSSQLGPDKWSALMLNSSSFELSCVESRPGHEQQLPCAGLIAVCEWSNGKLAEKDQSTHWTSENLGLPDLLQSISQSASFTRTIDVASK